ncbi:helix-turn-helix transcriptional regulator [Actinomycetes bacterium KLBMP 9759]
MAVLMREAIGDTLRRARTARRRTLRDVSRRARVSLGYLSEVERGRKEPSSELLAAICEALDMALHELLSEAAETIAEAAAAAAERQRAPIGLRHMDLRIADARPVGQQAGAPMGVPVPGTVPIAPVSPALPRPVGAVRAAA